MKEICLEETLEVQVGVFFSATGWKAMVTIHD